MRARGTPPSPDSGYSCILLLESSLPRFFLCGIKLLLGGFNGLLLVGHLLLILRVFFIPLSLIPQTVAGVGIYCGCT